MKIYTVVPFYNGSHSNEINHNIVKSFHTFVEAKYYIQRMKIEFGVYDIELIENEFVENKIEI